MQGWRADMEDDHLQIMDIIPNVHLFGIFDGHGGQEVANYVADHLPRLLKDNQLFQQEQFKEAFVQVFKQLDNEMRKNEYENLKIYQKFPEEKSKAGCTANLLLIKGDYFMVINLGDS